MSDLSGEVVLVTGAGGFIASHLCEALVMEGASVRGFVRYNSRNDRGMLNWLDRRSRAEIEAVAGDLRDVESVDRACGGRRRRSPSRRSDCDPLLLREPARLLRD